jgi:dihydrofolate synthase/folylpolyglutamate synthase
MQSILTACGYKTGWFTSPHLYRETDRIRIGSEEIDAALLTGLVKEAYAKWPKIKLFEAYFYAALRHFEQQRVDVAVLETGIGGTFDATNIVWPSLCMTGTIGFDHTALLGNTLPLIAAQKAGIAKAGVPFVLSPGAEASAREAFSRICREAGAPLCDLDDSVLIRRTGEGFQCFDAIRSDFELKDVRIRMRGAYQVQNAWTAAYAAHKLNEEGFAVRETAIRQGLFDAVWPGRLEWFEGKPPLLVDGAHNSEGARFLVEAVNEMRGQRRTVLLIGMMEDKDTSAVARELDGCFDAVVATAIDYHRAMPAEKLAILYKGAIAVTPPEAALDEAKRLAGEDGLVVVAGSLYLPSALKLG